MSTIYGDGFIADRYLSRNLRLDEAADSKVEAPAHGITRTGPAKVSGRHLSLAPNAADFLSSVALAGLGVAPLAAHTITRKSSGFGLGDSTRVECSCGWCGPERHEYQGNKCQLLADDERDHRSLPDLARAIDELDMGGRR